MSLEQITVDVDLSIDVPENLVTPYEELILTKRVTYDVARLSRVWH